MCGADESKLEFGSANARCCECACVLVGFACSSPSWVCVGPYSSAGYRIATVVIPECYEEPATVSDASVVEGSTRFSFLEFRVTRSGPNETATSIGYRQSMGRRWRRRTTCRRQELSHFRPAVLQRRLCA